MPKSPPPGATPAESVHAVLDTNVLVSGLLKPGSVPARLLALVPSGILIPVYTDAILAEYEEVLARPHFSIEALAAEIFLASLRDEGLKVTPLREERIHLPDPDDYPFVAAARAGACPIVTGNLKHYPAGTGVEAVSPAQFLVRIDRQFLPGAK